MVYEKSEDSEVQENDVRIDYELTEFTNIP